MMMMKMSCEQLYKNLSGQNNRCYKPFWQPAPTPYLFYNDLLITEKKVFAKSRKVVLKVDFEFQPNVKPSRTTIKDRKIKTADGWMSAWTYNCKLQVNNNITNLTYTSIQIHARILLLAGLPKSLEEPFPKF